MLSGEHVMQHPRLIEEKRQRGGYATQNEASKGSY